jgi:predicted nucleotidyltransferase component of viral defense system
MNNLTASIQDKLRNIAKTSGKDFQLILTRYFQERLLYRLSQTVHRDNFCLKGGALLYAFERETSRPTLDIDFLSLKIRIEQKGLPKFFGKYVVSNTWTTAFNLTLKRSPCRKSWSNGNMLGCKSKSLHRSVP